MKMQWGPAGFIVVAALFAAPCIASADALAPAGGIGGTALENQSVVIELSGTANSGEDQLTFTVATPPSHGTLGTITTTGLTTATVEYTPENDYSGTDSFEFTVSEGESTSEAAEVDITIDPAIQFLVRAGSFSTSTVIDLTNLGPGINDYNLNDDTATPHTINDNSVLAALDYDSDSTTVDSPYHLSDLQFFSGSPSGFFVNCINIPEASSSPLCGNWQYEVNGVEPSDSIDQHVLTGGENVAVFFGDLSKVVLSTNTATSGTPFTATAENYDPNTDTFVPETGVQLGVFTGSPFSPSTVQLLSVDGSGNAIFTLNATGTYEVATYNSTFADFNTPVANITIVDAATSSEATSTPPTDTGSTTSASGGTSTSGGGGGTSTHQFDVPAALAFLTSKQHSNGSFDNDTLTDWAALAYGARGSSAAATLLHNYLLTATPSLSSAPDYERHAMALEALGINPINGTPTNYIAGITSKYDGTQIGSSALDNDDIFALFPLTHAGYSASDTMIQHIVAFVLGKQKSDGSWDESVDMTAAGIQALSPFSSLPGVSTALTQAENYLRSQQNNGNGGFTPAGEDSASATSWALQAITALSETPSGWTRSGATPLDYLATQQQSDGGVDPASADSATRVWATEYAIPAALGKSWNSILQSFGGTVSSGSGSGSGNTSTSGTATSTASTATTTPPVATTTPPTSSQTQVLGAETQKTETQTTVTEPAPATGEPYEAAYASSAPSGSAATSTPTSTAQSAAAALTDTGFSWTEALIALFAVLGAVGFWQWWSGQKNS